MSDNITYDDPWGDNIQLAYKDGKLITGKEADKYGAMDTTELPFMLIQDLYNKSGRDLKRSMKALERINGQIEKDPDFDKYGGGDYLTRWYELTENPFESELPMDNQMTPEDFR